MKSIKVQVPVRRISFKKAETRYADLKYDRKAQHLEGKTNMGFDNPADVNFSASINLLSVNLAMEIEPMTISQFMSLADGYGEPGLFPGGYDWSGIRDASPASKRAMHTLAGTILGQHKDVLKRMGLPEEAIADLVGSKC